MQDKQQSAAEGQEVRRRGRPRLTDPPRPPRQPKPRGRPRMVERPQQPAEPKPIGRPARTDATEKMTLYVPVEIAANVRAYAHELGRTISDTVAAAVAVSIEGRMLDGIRRTKKDQTAPAT